MFFFEYFEWDLYLLYLLKALMKLYYEEYSIKSCMNGFISGQQCYT